MRSCAHEFLVSRGSEFIDEIPEDCTPIDIDVIQDGYRILSPGAIMPSPEIPPLSSLSLREYMNYQKDYERCALLRFDLLGRDIHDVLRRFGPWTRYYWSQTQVLRTNAAASVGLFASQMDTV